MEGLCKMGFSQQNEYFRNLNLWATFVTLWEWSWGISSQNCDSWWNVSVSLWTRQPASVHGISSQHFTSEKNFRIQSWAWTGQLMAVFFWDADGVVLVDFLNLGPPATQSATSQHSKLWLYNQEELRMFYCNMTTLYLTPHEPSWRQFRSWISPLNTPAMKSRLGAKWLPPVSKNEARLSWTSVWRKWRGGKYCQDVHKEPKCGVLSWQLWETCPSSVEVCVENCGDYV
jgi:hypothetical protein